MIFVKLLSRPGLFRSPHFRTSNPAPDSKQGQESKVPIRNSSLCWQFGEISAQDSSVPPKVKPRISCDISQWTEGFLPIGHSLAPSSSMNLPIAISTWSSLSSHGGSTQTELERDHTFPLTRKLLSFPLLRRNLLVFLGSLFS